jgi:hypothetical protein
MKNKTSTHTTTMTKVDNNMYGGKKIFYRLSADEDNVFKYCNKQGIDVSKSIILAHGTPNKKADGTEKTTYRFVICDSTIDAYSYLHANKRLADTPRDTRDRDYMKGLMFYEIIDTCRRAHPYFDIDYATDKKSKRHANEMMTYIGLIVTVTRDAINATKDINTRHEVTYDDFTIYTSCGKVSSGYKYSYHIVVSGVLLDSYMNCRQLFNEVKTVIKEYYEDREPFMYIDPKKNVPKCSMDEKVYSKYRQFRMLGNSKSKDGARTKIELLDDEGNRYVPYIDKKDRTKFHFPEEPFYPISGAIDRKVHYDFLRSLISPINLTKDMHHYQSIFGFKCEKDQIDFNTESKEEMWEKLQEERPDIASELKPAAGSYLHSTNGEHICHVNGDNTDPHKGSQQYSLFETKWGYHLSCLSCCMDAPDNPSIKASMRFFTHSPEETEEAIMKREARNRAEKEERARLASVYNYEREGLPVPEHLSKPIRPVYETKESIRARLAPGNDDLEGYKNVAKFEDDGVNNDDEQDLPLGPDKRGFIYSSLQQNEDESMERTAIYQTSDEDGEPSLTECKIKPYSYMGLRGKYTMNTLSALTKPLEEPIHRNSMLDCYLKFADLLYVFLATISPFYKINLLNELVVWDEEKHSFKTVGVVKGIKAGCVTITMNPGFEGTKDIKELYTIEELMNARFLQKYSGNKRMRSYIRAIESLNLHLTVDNICRLPYFKGSKVPLYEKDGINIAQGYKAVVTDKKHKDLDKLLNFVKMGYVSGNEEHYDMLMRNLKGIMTNVFDPRTQKCFFNKGPQGVGKTQFIEWLINCVFGRNHACTMGIHGMFNKFNGSRAEKVLILIDEPNIATMGKNAPSRANARAEFKKLITEFFIEVERKGKEIFTGQNLNNYIINSNIWKNPLVDPADIRRWIFILSRAMSILPSGVFIFADNVEFINAYYEDGTPLTDEDKEISRKMGKDGHHAALFSGPNAYLRSLFKDPQNLANAFVTYILNYDTKGRDIRSMCQSKNDVVRKEALSNLDGNFGHFAKALENPDGYLWLSTFNPPAELIHDDKNDYRHRSYFVTNEKLYNEYKAFVDTYYKSMANIDKIDDFKAYFDDLCTYRDMKTSIHKCFSKCGSTVHILTNPEDNYPEHKFSEPTDTRCMGITRAGYYIKVQEIYGRSSKQRDPESGDEEEDVTPKRKSNFNKHLKESTPATETPSSFGGAVSYNDDDNTMTQISYAKQPEPAKTEEEDDPIITLKSSKKTTITEATKIPTYNIIPADIPESVNTMLEKMQQNFMLQMQKQQEDFMKKLEERDKEHRKEIKKIKSKK